MQSLKYDNNEYKVDDKFKIEIPVNKNEEKSDNKNNSIFSWLSEDFWNKTSKNTKKKLNNNKIIEEKKNILKNIEKTDNKENKVKFVNFREKLKLTNIENNILKSLKKYKLKKVELNPRLFDLTDEYPDEYFEYYGKDMTFYFFWNKNYTDLRDIFEVLSYELPFKIKEVNNFGQNSFYINLNTLFEDGYIRIVIKKSNRTFWLKIKKELYNKIKNNLWVIFKK